MRSEGRQYAGISNKSILLTSNYETNAMQDNYRSLNIWKKKGKNGN